ncbi:hypothetical protein C7999DRAFT_18162 [Corynascus novoguineensis]|uniref:Zn(2)-C6 fungal-type domain-containing protein n=1 Tax=Corynascus novoguineensis TaxID=1126955 RepID=A0AAN7HIQ4_9PEZI|nr:hypothetical protein C7999DRAFT_18162 [Corynascus novoguineensis]
MSATSSSPTTSPVQPLSPRPQHNCLECKRLKRACDKKLPCGKCEKTGRTCEYKDPGDDGVYGPISAAKDVHSLAFGTLLEILVHKQRIRETVSSYFDGVNTWFTIIERQSFERELEANWGSVQAETSAAALCMALVARPPNQKSSKGLGDNLYSSTKAILSVVQSRVPVSIKMLQAELLVALYEFSHSMSQQAYFTLGRCLQMTKALGWHREGFWALDKQVSAPANLKLCSILCLLNVAYQDPTTQAYPMNTVGLNLGFIIPFPDALDEYFPATSFRYGGQSQDFRDANSHHIAGIVFPEAMSAWYIYSVLQQLSNPSMHNDGSRASLSIQIVQHMRSMGTSMWRASDRAIGTDLIALMKLHQPHLAGMPDPVTMLTDPDHLEDVSRIRRIIDIIHGKAGKIAQAGELDRGAVDPSWAFAMCYASQLLISYGYNTLQDPNWLQKVTDIRAALERVSKRWKIAEQYFKRVTIDLDNRLAARVIS